MKLLLVASAMTALVLTSCQSGAAVDSAFVTLDEGVIDVSSSRLADGPVELRLDNVGNFAHTLVVEAMDGRIIAATDLIGSEESADLAVDLEPGDYRFTCRIVSELDDGSLLDHYEFGMETTVEVVAG